MKDSKATIHIVRSFADARTLSQTFNIDSKRILDLSDLNSNPLDIDELHKEQIDQQYLEFIAQLGEIFRSQYWWASAISEKNELLSKCYIRFFVLNALEGWLKKKSTESAGTICIVCTDQLLVAQIQGAFSERFLINAYSTFGYRLQKVLRNYMRFICKLILLIAREMKHRALSQRYLTQRVERIKQGNSWVAIKVWVDHRTYQSGKYIDSYFHKLPQFFVDQKIDSILIADIISDYERNLKKMARDPSFLIVTLEYFFSFSDLWQAVIASINERLMIKDKIKWKQLDLTQLVVDENEESFFSTKFLENILYFFKLRMFIQQVGIKVYLQTFENYAWEKMCLLAIQQSGKKIKTTGFQHAFISKNSFRYFLGSKDVGRSPSPDKILTMGRATQRILTSYGHWPTERVVVGCALRQEQTMALALQERSVKKDVLVCFTMSPETSAQAIQFLYDAGLADYPHALFLRLHPLTAVADVLKRLSFPLPKNFIISEGKTLFEDFKRVGVVLYSLTTVALEALKVGLPVVYMDINKPFYLDPLFESGDLKESVSSPDQLKGKIEQLLNLDSGLYQDGLTRSHQYLNEYFSPVTEEAMYQFVN